MKIQQRIYVDLQASGVQTTAPSERPIYCAGKGRDTFVPCGESVALGRGARAGADKVRGQVSNGVV
jgi:hypothetical protein